MCFFVFLFPLLVGQDMYPFCVFVVSFLVSSFVLLLVKNIRHNMSSGGLHIWINKAERASKGVFFVCKLFFIVQKIHCWFFGCDPFSVVACTVLLIEMGVTLIFGFMVALANIFFA